MRTKHRAGGTALTWIAAVVAVVALLGTACSSGEPGEGGGGAGGTLPAKLINEDPGAPRAGGKLTFGLGTESEGLSPVANQWNASTYVLGFSIMDPLAAYGTDLEPKPYLARELTPNADFTEWTIGLRDGVELSDGTPVDGALVKANLDAQKASFLTAPSLAFIAPDGITAPDARTVKVRMLRPWSTFAHVLTSQVGAVASVASLSTAGGADPVGSGPFTLVEWVKDRSAILRKNPNYWRAGYPLLDEIEFRPISAASQRGATFDSGEIQIYETGDAPQILAMTRRAEQGQAQVLTEPEANSAKVFIGLNVTKAPFDDVLARRAVATAIDTKALSDTIFEGVFPPADSVYNTGSPGHVRADAYPRFDTAEAKKLADEYRTKHGRPIEFSLTLPPTPEVIQIATVVQQQLKDAGITLTTTNAEPIKLGMDAFFGQFQATMFVLFGSPHLDREYVFLASTAQRDNLSLNFTRVGVNADGTPNQDNARVVEAMDKARATADPAEQARQYEIVQQEMGRNLSMVFLVAQRGAIVFAPEVHGPGLAKLPTDIGADGAPMRPDGSFTFNLWRAA